MSIETFDDLLRAARAQPEPQRLLFVFANAVLPDDSTPEQRARFEAGEGGALEPLMSVDKTPDELGSFEALVEEAQQFGKAWAVVFVAALSGRNGRAPTSKDADAPREQMIASIKAGLLRAYLPFDTRGAALLLS
jgi:hypothetical protein